MFLFEPNHGEKLCPRCQSKFVCDEAEGCWCEKVQVSRETLKMLRTKYVDCLCKECLSNMDITGN